MALNDVTITKLSGGLGRRLPNQDMISGLIANGVAVAGGVQLDTVYELKSVKDAEDLMLDDAYDADNGVLVYEHIREFFRINPSGTLYLLLRAQTVAFSDFFNPSSQSTNARLLLIAANGDIRQLAAAYNPDVAVADTAALEAAITDAQAFAEWVYDLHMPCEIFLEGKGYDKDEPLDFHAEEAENVTVVVGQNMSVVNGNGDATYAAVGTWLGAVSRGAVNENPGWVAQFDMYQKGVFESAGISGTPVSEIASNVLDNLNDDGAVFFRYHTGRPGIYWNDSFTCTVLTSDFAYVENNRTIHKAVRLIRQALLPRINSPILIDQESGQLSPEVIKSIETDGRKALETMLSNNEVSGIDIFIDPAQNILSTSKLEVQFSIVPTGTARTIEATIGFDNPF